VGKRSRKSSVKDERFSVRPAPTVKKDLPRNKERAEIKKIK